MNLAVDVMQDVKKVEIIINSLYLEKALAILDNIKVSGYTIIEDTSGKGDRGVSCSALDCDFSSHYIMTVCTNEQQLNTLLEQFTPLLKKVGGICFVIDAKWISH
ncbi:transcriptional regulator [Candidatus Gracilibacteria bacterium]|nr:transcriptional regulator [Candidatus Gracilibacteria bacterium]NJM87914.1 transcriptional regulator [Hydrococcus sp. RU_2_2]NJP20002.1 transcriptional regulator [Hydrococcus sp. CRU_1_1]